MQGFETNLKNQLKTCKIDGRQVQEHDQVESMEFLDKKNVF